MIEEIQLEGHLGITKEIVGFLSVDAKRDVGSGSGNLLRILIDEYIFPASRAMVIHMKTGQRPNLQLEEINPICSTANTLQAAFDALVALCTGCVENLRYVTETLSEMFYEIDPIEICEWEYVPPVGPRPTRGFVGLKNAGATCYMNSVLQQVRLETDHVRMRFQLQVGLHSMASLSYPIRARENVVLQTNLSFLPIDDRSGFWSYKF